MQGYRLYLFDAVKQHLDIYEFIADDDSRAVRIAEARGGALQMELWAGRRKVRSWRLPTDRDALAA